MENVNWVALVVAVLGAGGLGACFREIVSVVTKVREGVSAQESRRKSDIVAQRDHAIARADRAEARADDEARIRRLTQEYASELRRDLIELGEVPAPWPDFGGPRRAEHEAPGPT